ncbi:uncharacterized protein LOC133926405 [Phragmites australis]|uniref:uncharacterized protein LOC133926405 n=1 Tax=Phragmites australis TaxID=29695 RepID=UPI002D780331|nr:uncharacterized protein LOC133926405 [Phragmites australis]
MLYIQRPSNYIVSLIILLPLTLLCITFLLPLSAYLSNPLVAGSSCVGGTAGNVRAAPAADDDAGHRPEISVLVGVHTTARKHSRRHLIRMEYALQQTPALRGAARVDVRFALCARPMPPEHRAFVALEARAHGDVLLFDCAESADQGKTYTYFAGLPSMLGAGAGGSRPYDYVMKVDDDTFLRLDALVETLRAAPREDMYCGVGLPFHDRAFPPFMLGMGYLLSWDLVEWIASSDMVRREATGAEDVTTGKWLNMGNKAKNRVNVFPRMYDYKSAKAEDFLENTIGVHQLKQDIRWAHTLEHFNLTTLELFNF